MKRPIRTPLKPRDIMQIKMQGMSEKERAEVPNNTYDYTPQLYRELVMPSYVHGYSIAIEYMKGWFLNKFEKGYFKNVNINGRHVLSEWKHLNEQVIKRDKPMLAIVPTIDFDYDRDMLDAYMGDRRLLLHKSDYQQSFFKDYHSKTFIYAQARALRMNFNFRIRVGSRAEQIDLWNKMEIWFRVGATEHEYISADFHIPHELMMAVAEANGFEIVNGEVKHVFDFVTYLNQHSDIPIIFKMRAINQKSEYFMRAKNIYTHIACRDKIQPDDGEKEGRLENNFHLDFQCVLTIPVPHFYVYFNQKPLKQTIEVGHEAIGIYTINTFEIPEENALGWGQMAISSYLADKGEQYIDLHQIFDGDGDMCQVMRYNLQLGISPDSFIDIHVYRSADTAKLVKGYMDYRKLCFIFNEPMEREDTLNIVIYADKGYINDTMIMLHNYNESRIDKSKL